MAILRTLVLAASGLCLATGALAQGAPNLYGDVPAARAAFVEENGGATDRVFGGRQANDGEHPYQVALLRADSIGDNPESQYSSQFCGGSLIAPDWVLTAAHCLSNYGEVVAAANVAVLSGTTDLMQGEPIPASRVIVHEGYNEWTLENDIALIQLSRPASAPPVAIDRVSAGAGRATVTGWGLTEDGEYPRYLIKSDIEVVPNAQCNNGIKTIYARSLREAVVSLGSQYGIDAEAAGRLGDEMALSLADPLSDTMLCAGLPEGGRDSCYGDSGGPLVTSTNGQVTQIGVVSWGEGPADAEIKCGHAGVYGVYSRVSSFAGWIDQHTR